MCSPSTRVSRTPHHVAPGVPRSVLHDFHEALTLDGGQGVVGQRMHDGRRLLACSRPHQRNFQPMCLQSVQHALGPAPPSILELAIDFTHRFAPPGSPRSLLGR